MKKRFRPYYLLWVLFGILAGCQQGVEKKMPSLKETFRKGDTQPFGAEVAYTLLQQYYGESVSINYGGFTSFIKKLELNGGLNEASAYFLLTKNLVLTSGEVGDMVSYVGLGNTLFISADYIDSKLLDAFLITVSRMGEMNAERSMDWKDTYVSVKDPAAKDSINKKYGYYFFPFLNFVASFDDDHVEVLGKNEIGKPDFIVYKYKRGNLFIHLAPRTFSNYFLLSNDNYGYAESIYSYLPDLVGTIYWDEFYKNLSTAQNQRRSLTNQPNNNESNGFSSFSVISNNPPLFWAFITVSIALVIFMIFNLKRRQRPIPLKKTPDNATLEFTHTIGRLYLQNKNNKKISAKMITYFYEGVRNKYFINKQQNDKDYLASLSGKSGVPLNEVMELFETIQYIQSSEKVEDAELIKLNTQIESFNRKKNDRRKNE